jgi:protease-4
MGHYEILKIDGIIYLLYNTGNFRKGFIMDFEQKDNLSVPIGPEPQQPIGGLAAKGPTIETQKKGIGWKIFWGIIMALSIIANIALCLMLIGLFTVFATGQRTTFAEEIIRDGPRSAKIAVIALNGVIDDEQFRDFYKHIRSARKDKRVKGLIIRVNSPGGTVSDSDQIHNEILKYREETGKPVIAFMEGIAASGGYYTSVACEKIMAEPTTITGSVGVVAGFLVLQDLLEGKLGIKPYIIKKGEKKDWPSSFRQPSPEELQYLDDRLLTPAYERFVQLVDEGRPELTIDDVKRLADGSIYGAQEALNEKLIDGIGYLDDAIELVKSMAEIEKAEVIEYHKRFSWADYLSTRSQSFLNIDRSTLYELNTPQILYLWSAY